MSLDRDGRSSTACARRDWPEVPATTSSIRYKKHVKIMMATAGISRDRCDPWDNAQYSIMSINNPNHKTHTEPTDAGAKTLPVAEMPTNAVRRAIIAALQVIKDRNSTITDASQKDRVSLIVFDAKNTGGDNTHVQILNRTDRQLRRRHRLLLHEAASLQQTMSTCTDSDGGLIMAYDHIKPESQGGAGRENVNKVVVFLTDGQPNLYESNTDDVDRRQGRLSRRMGKRLPAKRRLVCRH